MMRELKIFILLLGLTSCNTYEFNEDEANKIVVLTQDDLQLYEKLQNEIFSDLIQNSVSQSRLQSETPSIDTAIYHGFTGSYDLYKIDHDSYAPLIEKLKTKKVFTDVIYYSNSGTIEFRLKENTDCRELPYFNYTHALVYQPGEHYIPAYSGLVEVLKDSTLNENWSYIYYKAQVGH